MPPKSFRKPLVDTITYKQFFIKTRNKAWKRLSPLLSLLSATTSSLWTGREVKRRMGKEAGSPRHWRSICVGKKEWGGEDIGLQQWEKRKVRVGISRWTSAALPRGHAHTAVIFLACPFLFYWISPQRKEKIVRYDCLYLKLALFL